ncbi:MAG: hypothetical protein SOY99_04995 [Alloprevotella sp.]|nr:hypothetical protein [Bacteroidales bacterium]MDY3943567.1 hypothetical protein [Alloprevotella sp.]
MKRRPYCSPTVSFLFLDQHVLYSPTILKSDGDDLGLDIPPGQATAPQFGHWEHDWDD